MFAIIMTVLLGAVLAFTSESLKEKQAAEREFERKKFILSAALGSEKIKTMAKEDRAQVEELYNSRVKDYVVDNAGEKIDGLGAGDVNVRKEYKLAVEERKLPVYTLSKDGSEEVEFYILPVYGYGLWDNIFGFVSLQSDLNTVQGVILDHVGETPGLGARITETAVQNRYIGKSIYEGDNLVSVDMQKGEGVDYSSDPHKINGMTGATITGVGVNEMMLNYLTLYENFFNQVKGE
ncbi:MAG: NADH:ubiquinone reductase (Na(+)-transporting) subunit C [Bacteroidia bacterium]